MNELSNFTDNLPAAIGKFKSKGILTDAELYQLFDVVKHRIMTLIIHAMVKYCIKVVVYG